MESTNENMVSIIGIWQLILIALVFSSIILFVLALISILKNNFKGNDKLIWILVTVCIPVLGPILYFIIGRKTKINQDKIVEKLQ